MALSPGQRLEGTSYQVVRELGAGGMGVVYEVEHVRLKKRYVAKVIHEQIRAQAGAKERMEREAQVLADLNHPNVVQVHDVGTTSDGTSYFVMEKLEGMDLRAAMKTPMPRGRALTVMSEVLDALDHVHQRGITHRDVKPENIFLAQMPNGVMTKVLDFGIVHIFDGDRGSQARITKTGGFVGTLYYAAPEQMQGQKVGPANDIYAAGIVLYELLVGRGPFDDDPGLGLSRCFKVAPPLPDPSAPPELVSAVAAALEMDPDKRPSAGALAARLRQVLSTVVTTPSSLPLHGISDVRTYGTEMPRTPLMRGAPVLTASLAPTMAVNEAPIAAPPRSQPRGETSPGVYATVSSGFPGVPRRTSSGVIVATIVGFVVVIAGVAGIALAVLRKPAAVAPVVAAPSASVVPSVIPSAVTTAEPEPAVAAAETAAPSASASVVRRPAAAPAPKKGSAKKDGYMEDL
jgi:serine/threonine-protein kinase